MAMMLTQGMIDELESAVEEIAASPGWGEVTLVIERGQPVRLVKAQSTWLGSMQRPPPPPRATTQTTR